jgi:hypothetical protein
MKFSKNDQKKRLTLEDFKTKKQSVTAEKALAKITGGVLAECHP